VRRHGDPQLRNDSEVLNEGEGAKPVPKGLREHAPLLLPQDLVTLILERVPYGIAV